MATVTGTIVHAVIHTVVELEQLDVSHTSADAGPAGTRDVSRLVCPSRVSALALYSI